MFLISFTFIRIVKVLKPGRKNSIVNNNFVKSKTKRSSGEGKLLSTLVLKKPLSGNINVLFPLIISSELMFTTIDFTGNLILIRKIK